MAMNKLPLHFGLGSALRKHRKEELLTQEQLGGDVGFSIPTVQLLERKHGNITSWDNALPAIGLRIVSRNLPAGEPLGKSIAALGDAPRNGQTLYTNG
jgi:transcriptional regulator with XRE-family HTH domain